MSQATIPQVSNAFIPSGGIQRRVVAAFERAGIEHNVVTYPGAPHGFFDRRATDFAEASADAWRQVLGFIEKQAK